MRLFRRTRAPDESIERMRKIKAEVIARVEDVTRHSKSAQLADLFSSMLEEDVAFKRGQPPPQQPQEARDTQAA